MAKTTKATAAKPLEQLEKLLPKVTHEELLTVALCAHLEIGRRAQQYADAIYEIEEPPVDLMNEALSFCVRADDLVPFVFDQGPGRMAYMALTDAKKDIKNMLNGSAQDMEDSDA